MGRLEILKGARELISEPEHWGQRAWHDGVDKYCAIGAVMRAKGAEGLPYNRYLDAEVDDVGKALARAIGKTKRQSVQTYNDDPNTSHECVIAMFDAAIAREEAERT